PTSSSSPTSRRNDSARSIGHIEVEEFRRVAPKDLLLVGGRDRKSVDDVDVLPGIDRYRAVVGAEHYPVNAKHLHRLADVRRPEAHRVAMQALQIFARHLLAPDDRTPRHALAAEAIAEVEPAHAGQ